MNYSALICCLCTVTPGSPQRCFVLLPLYLCLWCPISFEPAAFPSPFLLPRPPLTSTPLSWLSKLLAHFSRVSSDSFLVLSLSLSSHIHSPLGRIHFSFHTLSNCVVAYCMYVCGLLKGEIMVCLTGSRHLEMFTEWITEWLSIILFIFVVFQ